MNSKQSVERRRGEIGLQALINGLNCFKEYLYITIGCNSKHLSANEKKHTADD